MRRNDSYFDFEDNFGRPSVNSLIVILSDKSREPIDLILKTFFMGILLCLVAGQLNSLLIPSFDNICLLRRDFKIFT